MPQVSIGPAIGSGFGVLARRPAAVLAWAAALFVLGVLPQALVVGAALPQMLAAYQEAARSALQGGHPSPDTFAAITARTAALQPISLLASLVSRTVLLGAIYRAVLEPEDRRFFYLRFGAQELWLALAMIMLFVIFVVLIVAAAVSVGIVAAIVAVAAKSAGGPGTVAALAIVAVVLAGVAVTIWLLIRLSLALPMGFAERNFRFFESWSLTRGHAFQMFLAYFGVFLIVLLIELAVVAAVAMGVMGAALADWRSLLSARPEDIMRRIAPWIPVVLVAGAFAGAVLQTLIAAPGAEIYRQLSAREPESYPL
jgi:hypothetical protein